MTPQLVDGDLLDQDVDVIINAWNRNIIPWWLLLPQGVAGAIKRRAGRQPFVEVARAGAIPLGGAVLTGPGRLPCKAIIHVAAINMWWRASEHSVRLSTANAMRIVDANGYRSVAFPILGSGSGGLNPDRALAAMNAELATLDLPCTVRIVRFARRG